MMYVTSPDRAPRVRVHYRDYLPLSTAWVLAGPALSTDYKNLWRTLGLWGIVLTFGFTVVLSCHDRCTNSLAPVQVL